MVVIGVVSVGRDVTGGMPFTPSKDPGEIGSCPSQLKVLAVFFWFQSFLLRPTATI
jgi:hypothetical protein